MCKSHPIVIHTKLVDTIYIWQFEPCAEHST